MQLEEKVVGRVGVEPTTKRLRVSGPYRGLFDNYRVFSKVTLQKHVGFAAQISLVLETIGPAGLITVA